MTNYLNFQGIIDLNDSEEPAYQGDEIVIEINRKESNEFITTGEIHVRGTNIRGATLELGRGTMVEECLPCADNNIQYSCKRIPAGIYKFELNNDTQQGKLKYRHRAIRLANTNGYKVGSHTSKRDGVLIHRGNSYSYSQGCILAMYSDRLSEILIDMDAYLSDTRMGYNVDEEEKAILPLAIYEYIERADPGGTRKKTVIITDEEEGSVLSVDTQVFKNRQQAGKYYVGLGVAAKAEEVVEGLAYKAVEDLLKEKGVIDAVEALKTELATQDGMTAEQKQTALAEAWNDKMEEVSASVNVTEANKKAEGYRTEFMQSVKSHVVSKIQEERNSEFADSMWDHMYDYEYGGSSPGSPFKREFLDKSYNKQKWLRKVEGLVSENFTLYTKNVQQKISVVPTY